MDGGIYQMESCSKMPISISKKVTLPMKPCGRTKMATSNLSARMSRLPIKPCRVGVGGGIRFSHENSVWTSKM